MADTERRPYTKPISVRLNAVELQLLVSLKAKLRLGTKQVMVRGLNALSQEDLKVDLSLDEAEEVEVLSRVSEAYNRGRRDSIRQFPGFCLTCGNDVPIDLRAGTRQRYLLYQQLVDYLVHDGPCNDRLRDVLRPHAGRFSFGTLRRSTLANLLKDPPYSRFADRSSRIWLSRFDPDYKNYDPDQFNER